MPQFFTLPRSGGLIVVLGVNHQKTGMARYTNLALMELQGKSAVAGIEGTDQVYTESAKYYADGGGSEFDHLYAVTLAQECSSEFAHGCVRIAPKDDHLSLNSQTLLAFIERAYLDPETGTRPDDRIMVMPRVLIFEYQLDQ